VIDNHEPSRTQLGGPGVHDILPFSTSKHVYQSHIHLKVPKSIIDFEVVYNVTGENLDAPFKVRIHVKAVHSSTD
jgi:hypothetical protein